MIKKTCILKYLYRLLRDLGVLDDRLKVRKRPQILEEVTPDSFNTNPDSPKTGTYRSRKYYPLGVPKVLDSSLSIRKTGGFLYRFHDVAFAFLHVIFWYCVKVGKLKKSSERRLDLFHFKCNCHCPYLFFKSGVNLY